MYIFSAVSEHFGHRMHVRARACVCVCVCVHIHTYIYTGCLKMGRIGRNQEKQKNLILFYNFHKLSC